VYPRQYIDLAVVLTADGIIRRGTRFISLCPDGKWSPPSILSDGYRGLFPETELASKVVDLSVTST
jgi:hypothetical protein